ncbi:transcriptional regulator GcvA [Rhodospirillum centenum]|uniref:Glycine cleavage system transcriptional activator n=1 Tax=Rhodospirillum centenum (strain ATCC 51521 / SW) TaxID=414684 RepID=B6IWX1_RHOCS|nr:transcriptional regulator GcvA [Rhodospirillum centenum]ACJ00795.1 glycine cleavage system transcriptional activator [Rhodospirillum centenum SW]
MTRRLPPLNALRAFEAAARRLSFTHAAAELGVTQAAVSYQIRLLEEHVRQPLFRRLTRRLELTEAGRDLAEAVADGFQRIGGAVERLTERRAGTVLSISTLQTFASQWLVPRLGHFQVLHPEIAVRLDASPRMVDLEREFDVAIRNGRGDWPGLAADKVIDLSVAPVLSPALLERTGGLAGPADLLRLPLLDTVDPDDRRLWLGWFRQAGVPVEAADLPASIQFDTQQFSGQAAMMGQGVAMVCPAFFGPEIAAGRLVPPFPGLLFDTGDAFWVVSSRRRAQEPDIRAFRAWVLSEVTACAGAA